MQLNRKKLTGVCVALFVILCALVFVSQKAETKEETAVLLNGTKIPYVVQEGKTYLYLEDLPGNGFVADVCGYTADDTTYRYVLWTDGLTEDLPENTEIAALPPDAKAEIYINGLQIGCYALGQKPMVALEELAEIQEHTKTETFKTILSDAEGNQTIAEEGVEQLSENLHFILDGGVEKDLGFEHCSPYLVRYTKEKHQIALETVKVGEMVQTQNGTFPLKKVYAGELRGLRLVDLFDGYLNLTQAAEKAGVSFQIENGTLSIAEKSKILFSNASEPLGTLQYCKERVFQTALQEENGNQIDALLVGENWYIGKADVK